jgi:hypothetical protein
MYGIRSIVMMEALQAERSASMSSLADDGSVGTYTEANDSNAQA